jgi:hypothetical protein
MIDLELPGIAVAPEGECDKAKRSEPCDLTLVGMASCGCGKVYVRCRRHGGEAGAKKSLHSHRALYHPKETR